MAKLKCPKCGSTKVGGEMASFADVYEPDAVLDDPRAGIKQFTGRYKCLKCGNVF